MAADGPRLLSIAPNSGEIFSTTSANNLIESPREFVFRFDAAINPTSLNNGIRITRAGGDATFGVASPSADITVPPAYLNFPDSQNQRVVVARFAQPLLDDLYRVEIFGVDIASPPTTSIRDTAGLALKPRRAGTDRDTYDFNLELGTKIIAIVPQPIDRSASGVLTQRSKDIEVYFNDAELYNQVVSTGSLGPGSTNPKVVDPQYYNLIHTKDTISPNDDEVFRPNSIAYDPVLKRATLTFAQDIEQLPVIKGAGTFRLRIGSNAAVANSLVNIVPTPIAVNADPAGFLSGAQDLGTLSASFSTVLSEEIRVVSNPLVADFPGSGFEPGHRDIQDENHLGATADDNVETATVFYSFMDNQSYGVATDGRALFSSITPEQKARVREIFEFYSAQLGVDFVEHLGPTFTNDGIKKIVVGDLAPNGAVSGPLGVLGVAMVGGELAIMDGAEAWDNTFGYGSRIPNTISFFETTLHEIGHLLGFGHAYELPPGTIQGAEQLLGRAANPLEQVFPGDNDVVHGQFIFRPDNRDVDLYKFVVQAGAKGELRAETIAERLNDSSNLDTYLTLLKKEANGTLSIVAANNNYFSDDSFLNVNLEPGEYYISVTGKGNEDNNPLTVNSGSGAVSQGRYQLRVDFKSTAASQLAEERSGSTIVGSALDGDGDGLAGGNFEFWFRAATPFTTAGNPAVRTLFVDKAFGGTTRNGSLANPFNRIVEATQVARPGDIIRLVGDTRTASLTDDIPFEIGEGGGSVGTLSDGATLNVPRGVTLMIDAGAIVKFGGSSILVGSNDSTTDRSSSAIQVLGTPSTPVYFTSFQDESLGRDGNPLVTTATPGQWGGIEIRNDFDRAQGRLDREREGIFLNTISNADMRWGGGQVGVGALSKVVSPIDLSEARPLIIGNRISRSGDSAISADPNSFEETLFTETRYQNGGAFIADYSRIGPDIRSNTLLNNSINGLFVRIDTLAGQGLKPLSVPARINDSEITIVLGENLIIEGTPGGALREQVGPNTSLVTLTQVAPTSGTGFTSSVSLNYLITYVDRFGQESLPSAQKSTIVTAGQAIQLGQLPTATLDYVSRKIWRQVNNTGAFVLAGATNRDDTTFVDNGITLTGSLQTQGLVEVQRARRDASLVIDPGLVIKSLGGRIELGVSSTMLAEGTESKPIVFTSRLDDRYGAAGNFDTNNDGNAASPAAGNWAGILARHLGELSIDNAIITFGGGNSRVPGGFASFNAIEVHQSIARIANSLIENNASGTGTPGLTNRDARGVNDEAAIFVLGSQPVILNNVIRNNTATDTAAISIDANSLNSDRVRDYGRSTGFNLRENVGIGNFGPLVNNNQLGRNAINGLAVRGATLTTESIWDDTDIVHVLQSEIVVPDFHTYGGLRLTSKSDESLVVKLSGASAGFTATGRPLDIKDRIGGSLQFLGSPGFPVVLTSLSDDSIGAGFDFLGGSLFDTNNNGPSTGTPGSWRSVRFEPFSNDRNVDQLFERESDEIADKGVNDFPADAQDAGTIANKLNGGDENIRLGMTLTGSIASPSDIDVYRFVGTAGTTVWLDIDQTSGSLDSVVELVDANGQIIALSNNSIDESAFGVAFSDPALIPAGRVWPMDQIATAKRNLLDGTQVDFLSVNPLDAGFRIVLPGSAGSLNNYYVRVRSSNVSPVPGPNGDRSNTARLTNPALVREGITVGEYKLHLRLQQQQEVSGSTVRFADIRFATVGIDALGQPLHSQLLGEFGEANQNETNAAPASTINIGNILSNDRGAASIAGSLGNAGDIDWYDFSILRDSIQSVSTTNGPHQSVTFDIDYADGFGRANTRLWIFQRTATGLTLVATADNSNIQDDQPAALLGGEVSDLLRGSKGTRDAYIGPIELPVGNYTVALSNASLSHMAQEQFTNSTTTQSAVRFEPLDSVQRISEDRFDFLGRVTTNAGPVQTAFGRETDTSMTTAVPNSGNVGLPNAVPFNLSDVTLFVATNAGGTSRMQYANALTGAKEAEASTDGTNPINLNTAVGVNDIAVSPAGAAFGVSPAAGGRIDDANQGTFFGINIGDAGAPVAASTGSGLQTYARFFDTATPPGIVVRKSQDAAAAAIGDGMVFTGLTFSDFNPNGNTVTFWGVATRNGTGGFNETPPAILPQPNTRNIVYRLDPATGAALSADTTLPDRTGNGLANGAGTQKIELGRFSAAIGTVNGLATINQTFFGVTNQGELVTLNGGRVVINDPTSGAPINFTGMTAGPRNVENGRFANLLFGISTAGRIYAFTTAGVLQPIFARGQSFVQSAGLGTIAGIDFSSLDVNLWHSTTQDSGTAGHGRPTNFNNSRDTTGGDRSLKFGFSNPSGADRQIGIWNGIYDVAGFYDNTALPGGAMGALESDLIDLRQYSANDQPVLYFNYSTINQNAAANDNASGSAAGDSRAALDAFRVYGAGEDGQWVLLGTNNSARTAGNYTGSGQPDEFDSPVSGNEDIFGQSYISSELFDGQGWRQARVNLAPLAGKRDVRIRFEFSTSGDFRTGDSLRGGQELVAIPGERLTDGSTFVISGTTFEIDLGLVLNIPSGESIADGDQIRIDGTNFTFRLAPTLATDIPFDKSETPEQLATKVRTTLVAAGRAVTTSTLTPNVLNISGLNAAGAYSISGADPAIIIGLPGVAGTNVAVNVTNAMTATQVRDQIRISLARGLNIAAQVNNTAIYHVRGNVIVLHGESIDDQGPFGATTSRVGDFFGGRDGSGAFSTAAFLRAGLRTQTNLTTLLRLDDIVIGFAERGEMITGTTAGANTFNASFEYENIGGIGGTGAQENETGTYQLEIRTSADYGTTRNGELRLETLPFPPIQLGRTYDTNDRLSRTFALVFDAASQVKDGSTFTLSDGVNTAVFEFDVTTSAADRRTGIVTGNIPVSVLANATSVEIARAIRDAINSGTSQAKIKITASTSGDMDAGLGDLTGARAITIHLNGQVAADTIGGTGFSGNGVPLTLIEFGQDLSPLGTNFGEDIGDENVTRQQGQLIISSSSISNSSGFGLNIDAAAQAQAGATRFSGNRPYPGVVRNLVTLNSSNVTPGVVVTNNVITSNGSGGINISGDTTNTNGNAPFSVARVVNNTLFGRGASGVGINVNEGAAPTLLNNIVSNFQTGISVTPVPGGASTEIGGNLYKQNGANTNPAGLTQSFEINLLASDPLFVDSALGRFYLAAQSQAIDSSLASLENRSSIEQVTEAIGIPKSPIIAPSFDVNGLRRGDDPLVNTPAGQGQNVFIDRGAIDRVDFVGPIAVIQRPLDNDAQGVDRDSTDTYLRLRPGSYDFFEVLLDERTGTGTDPNTITRNSLILTENGRTLIEGVDYTFGFSANSRTIRLTPIAGFWRNDSVYEMTLINKPTVRIDASNGANTLDGSKIDLLTASGIPVTLEFDAVGSPPVTGSLVVTVPAAGGTGIADGATFSIRNSAGQTVVFEFDKNASVTPGNRAIVIADADSANTVATAISASIAGSTLGLTPSTLGATIRLQEPRGTQFNVLTSGLTVSGVSGGAIAIPYTANASFTSTMMSAQIVKALNSIGLGVRVFTLGSGTVLVEGVASATGIGVTQIAPITDLAGNSLQPNRSNSLTQFTIVMPEMGVDYGDAIERSGTGSTSSTRQINNGVRHALYPEDVPVLALGQFADADVDGKPSVAADGDDFGSSFAFSTGLPLSLSSKGPARLVVSTPVFPAILGKTIKITDAVGKTVTYEFTNTAAATGTNIAVNLFGITTAAGAAAKLQDTILTKSIFTGAITGIYSILDGDVVAVGGTSAHDFDLSNSGGFVQRQPSGAVGLAVPASVSGLAAGQTFTIQDGSGNSVTFQIINSAAPTSVIAGNIAINLDLTPGVQTQSSFANAVLSAINGSITAGRLRLPLATLANSTISVNADDDDGVTFVGQFNARTPSVSVNVTSTDTGYLDAWIDWNQDNDFDDASEQILRSESVNAGNNSFSVVTPLSALSGYTTARFRLSATGGLFTTGMAIGGEVEDHLIEILRGTPPTAVNDNYQVNEDAVLNVAAAGVLANDNDSDADPFTVVDSNVNLPGVQPLVAPQNGTLTLNTDGSFTYSPNPNFFGTDTFVYQVTDPRLVSNQPATVTITVTPVNDAPFGTNKRQVINEDNDGSPFTFSAASFGFNDPTDVPASNALLEVLILTLPPATDGVLRLGVANVTAGQAIPVGSIPTLTFTPVADLNGVNKGSFTFRVRDNGGVAIGGVDTSVVANTFAFDIVAVNDAPFFTLPTPTINLVEDPGPQSLANFITGIAAGPPAANDELASQTVTFRVRALDPSRFAVQPAVTPASIVSGNNGTFTFTLAPDVNNVNSGPILVELQADDQGGPGTFPNGPLSAKQTVTINVTQVNDPPTFTITPSTLNTIEDAAKTTIANFLSAVLVGPATAIDETVNQKATVSIAAANPSLFSVQPTLSGTGDLEFQLGPDVNSLFSGSLNILVTVTDDGSPNATAVKTLTINAAAINDAPNFTLSSTTVSVSEDEETIQSTADTIIPNFIQNLRRGPDTARDENGLESVVAQGLDFATIVASNPSLFSKQPTIDIATGNLVFHTAPDRSGSSLFVMRLTDNGVAGPSPNTNLGPTATFTIVIRAVNDAPEFTLPSQTTVNEDQGVVSVPGFATGVRPGPATAVDESTQELTFTVRAENPSVFAVQPAMQPDGTLVFQTAKDINNDSRDANGVLLSRRVFVSLKDNGSSISPNINQSSEQTFTINITPVNDPPIPSVHIRSAIEDTKISFTASSILNPAAPELGDAPGPKDEQAQGIRMTQIERTTDRGGVVTPIFGTGPLADQVISFEYNPPLNFAGDDLIRYVITDDGSPQQSATGTITIQLSPINDPPQFIAGGTVTVNEDALAYSAPWATGILAGPGSAIDEINGLPPNIQPQTVRFGISTNNNSLFSVLPAISSTGILTFTLAKDANGRAIVDVTAIDSGSGVLPNINQSSVAKLTIVATPVNDAPGFTILGNVTVDEDSSRYSGPAIASVVPAEGMNSSPPTGTDEVGQSVTILTSNNNTSLFSVQPTISASGVLEFVPAQDAFGTAIVSVVARDNGANTPPNINESAPKTFTITLRPNNDAPVAVNDRYSTGEDTVLTINAPGLVSNDRDVDLPNDTISVSTFQTTSTLGAIVSVSPNGQFTYDSRNAVQVQKLVTGDTGLDTFTYTLRDAAGLTSNLATVTISVSGNNDVPVAFDDNFSVPFGITQLLNVLANDKDPDTSIDPRTVEIGQLAGNGTAIAQPTGRVEYRPNPGFKGIDTFTYRVRDSLGALSNEAKVTIDINTSPVAVADFTRTRANTPIVIEVLRNDSDPDGTLNVNSVSIANGPDVGSAAVQAGGTILYTPTTNFNGTATLQYTVLDNDGLASNVATVTIVVGGSIHQNPVNNLDVDADGFVSPIDVLILVNDINFRGARALPSTLPTPPYLDPTGDGEIGPLDVLAVINFINARGNSGAGEGEGSMAALGYSQEIVRTPTRDEIMSSIKHSEYLASAEGQIDFVVSQAADLSIPYGPSFATTDFDESDESLEGYLAGLATKHKKSQHSLDSLFADEAWMD